MIDWRIYEEEKKKIKKEIEQGEYEEAIKKMLDVIEFSGVINDEDCINRTGV